jgi:hypothetical protein
MSEAKDTIVVGTKGGLEDRSPKNSCLEEPSPRKAGKLDVFIQGVALFSDGYNIQIAGYMNTVLAKL